MKRTGVFVTWLVVIGFMSQTFGLDSAEGIEYHGRIDFNASPTRPMYGLSSIRYVKRGDTHLLIMASDDTGAVRNHFGRYGQPRYYEFNLERMWSVQAGSFVDDHKKRYPKVEEHLIIEDRQIAAINSGFVDIEGLALFGDDDSQLLFAAEQGAAIHLDFIHPFIEWGIYPSLIRVSSSGKLAARYTFPDYYTDDRVLSWFLNYPYTDQSKDAKGIRRNKGIKSLDRIPGTNHYVAITEAPLLQDNRWWDTKEDGPVPSRLMVFPIGGIHANKSHGKLTPIHEYFYQLAPLPEEFLDKIDVINGYPHRGISDMAVINEHSALVVERNYLKYRDGKKPRFLTEVYKVNLGGSYDFAGTPGFPAQVKDEASKVLDKTLLLRTSDFEDQKSGGALLSKVNIEGMTFGPDFPDGSKLLLLLSYNDAAKGALSSSLFFFKVPANLVQ